MSNVNSYRAMQQYGQVGVHSEVNGATPHRLIQMLLEGALDKIVQAKRFMEQGKTAEKCGRISWALSIIEGLRLSLDKEIGGEIANNLDDLYEYMSIRLVMANLKNDPAILDEVVNLLTKIKSGWDAIPEEIRNAHAEGRLTAEATPAEAVAE